MGTAAWAIPVGVLAGLCGAMFVFIWWWFPRTYRRGIQEDMDRVDEERRQRQLAAQQEGGSGDVELGVGGDATAAAPDKLPAATTFKYQPPAYSSY